MGLRKDSPLFFELMGIQQTLEGSSDRFADLERLNAQYYQSLSDGPSTKNILAQAELAGDVTELAGDLAELARALAEFTQFKAELTRAEAEKIKAKAELAQALAEEIKAQAELTKAKLETGPTKSYCVKILDFSKKLKKICCTLHQLFV